MSAVCNSTLILIPKTTICNLSGRCKLSTLHQNGLIQPQISYGFINKWQLDLGVLSANSSDGFAYGAYTGVDFGYRFGKVFGLYQGNRFQFSKATSLPLTVYVLHVLGAQFDVSRHFYFSLEAGPAWLANNVNSDFFGVMSGNIGVHW